MRAGIVFRHGAPLALCCGRRGARQASPAALGKRARLPHPPTGVSRGACGGVGCKGVGGAQIQTQRSEVPNLGGSTGRACAPGPTAADTPASPVEQDTCAPNSRGGHSPRRPRRAESADRHLLRSPTRASAARPTTSYPTGVSRGARGGVGCKGVGGAQIQTQRSEVPNLGGSTGRACAPGPTAADTPASPVEQDTKASAASILDRRDAPAPGFGGTHFRTQRSEAKKMGGPEGSPALPAPVEAIRPDGLVGRRAQIATSCGHPPGQAQRARLPPPQSGVSRGARGGVGRKGVGGAQIQTQRSEVPNLGGSTGRACAPGPTAADTPASPVEQDTKASAASILDSRDAPA